MELKHQYKFRKARKIKRKTEISGLFKADERWNCAWCSVYCSKNGMNRNRCVIIVPKTTGNAVERNRTKRYVREYLRHFLQNTLPHIDILVKIHPAKVVNKSKHRLEKALALWFEALKK